MIVCNNCDRNLCKDKQLVHCLEWDKKDEESQIGHKLFEKIIFNIK